MLRWLPLLALAACLPGQHKKHVEATTVPRHSEAAPPPPKPPPTVRVALFEPSGVGTWDGSIALEPAPATLVAPCLPPGGNGWAWIKLETHSNEASATSVTEASPGSSESMLTCITRALGAARLPPEQSPMQLLVYITFSPEQPQPLPAP